MDIHSYYNKLDNGVIDVWKELDLSSLIHTADYSLHTTTEHDNLMTISYKYYDNIDDWWILYMFNSLYDINFSILSDNVLRETVDKALQDIKNYDSLLPLDALKIVGLVRDYYIVTGELKDSIVSTYALLNNTSARNDEEFLSAFGTYLELLIVEDSYINNKIKIPSLEVILKIKNKMEENLLIWRQNAR